MPIHPYGVLKGTVISGKKPHGHEKSPHYVILLRAQRRRYRLQVNVRSRRPPHEARYRLDENFRHPLTQRLEALPEGWTPIEPARDDLALDYVRGNLFDPSDLRALPHAAAYPAGDITDLLDLYVRRALRAPEAWGYAFGELFHGRGRRGVHDIHMNQGSSADFAPTNGVGQDGALLFHFPAPDQWVALFIAYHSQSFHTDDRTGQPVDPLATVYPAAGEELRIIAAVVHPGEVDGGRQSITLLNAGGRPIDLAGWQFLDQDHHAWTLAAAPLDPGATARLRPPDGALDLGLNGGTLTLLNPAGLKAHGVSYTRAQAGRAGRSIWF